MEETDVKPLVVLTDTATTTCMSCHHNNVSPRDWRHPTSPETKPMPYPLPLVSFYSKFITLFIFGVFFPSDACYLTLDPNTAHIDLILSDDMREVTGVKLSARHDNFTSQVLCRNGLTGRCYWEVEWKGYVSIGVTYKRVIRKGEDTRSWILVCSKKKYTLLHNGKEAKGHKLPFVSNRVGVYVDWPAGILSFFAVFSNRQLCLHTFNCTFTEPLYPEIRLWFSAQNVLCSASLCDL